MDFGNAAHLKAFPKNIDQWQGYDYDIGQIKEDFGADVALMRGYHFPGLYQPLFLLLMQARTETSFHPPPVCYTAQGWTIEEEGHDSIFVTDPMWIDATSPSLTVPLKKLIVFKEKDDRVTERRMVLYSYVKGNQFTSDTITMFRIETLAPLEGSYESVMDLSKEFLALTIPYMFEPDDSEEWNPISFRLIDSGIGGYIAIAILLLIPVTIIIVPIVRKERDYMSFLNS